ncbi:MAG TPA: hypothetical protein VKU60_09165 [Chloroflexota bacterium]|nr:hypothetical protein [Chloroflexota bacterium]
MGQAVLALVLSDLGKEARRTLAGLGLTVLIVLAFAISCLVALFTAAVPRLPSGSATGAVAAVEPAGSFLSIPLEPAPRSAVAAPNGPAGLAVMTAIANLGSQRWHDASGGSLCEQFVENMYGVTGQYPSAIAAWLAQMPNDPRQLARQRDLSQAPLGAEVYFTGGNQPYGHVGLYLGNGGFISAADGGVQFWNVARWQQVTGQQFAGWVPPGGIWGRAS